MATNINGSSITIIDVLQELEALKKAVRGLKTEIVKTQELTRRLRLVSDLAVISIIGNCGRFLHRFK